MSIMFSKRTYSVRGQQQRLEIDGGTFYRTAFEQGQHDSMLSSLIRMADYWGETEETALWGLVDWNNGERLDAAKATEIAQREGLDLTFQQPVFKGELDMLMERKRGERKRNLILSQGANGLSRYGGMFLAQMAGSMANPVDFASLFIPVVGSGGRLGAGARAGVKAGGIVSRAVRAGPATTRAIQRIGGRLGRPLIAEAYLPMPKLTGAVIEGATGNLLAEIPLAVSEFQSQSDYDEGDFLASIVIGGAFSGGFRATLDAVGRVLQRVDQVTHEVAVRKAIDQIAKGEDVDVARYIELDEGLLRSMAEFDEGAAMQRAEREAPPIEEARQIVEETEMAAAERAPRPQLSEQQIEARAQQYRQRAIESFVERERKAHDPEARYRELLAQEVAKQRAEGRVFKPAVVGERISKTIADDNARLDAEIEALQMEVLAANPEAKIDTTEIKNNEDVINAAINCIRTNG